jgi:hypothetical protein
MIITTTGLVAINLIQYGEPEVADWVLSCSDDEFVRICSVADWITFNGPPLPSGRGMLLDKALALAAVYIKECKPRMLDRSRRKKVQSEAETRRMIQENNRWPKEELMVYYEGHGFTPLYGVGDDLYKFWGVNKHYK